MNRKLLFTSFTTWLPHQKSNSSDDLLQEISDLHPQYSFLRQLPVDIELASKSATSKIVELQPDIIICCGMAQSRSQLTIEAKASSKDEWLNTRVNLHQLIAGINGIEISYDAGKFVCEGLYYSILKYLQNSQLSSHCIFVHIPILGQNNLAEIKKSFLTVVQRLTIV
ncbi:MAG: peptidase C15 [Chroococcus sp. CMT-3BRIN-NPC107]|jgi:pyroglutamyl-peptidase|nr:peptidase C15 [Chroococcus sp. CMT-3BRIN-NPC107]